MTDTPKPEEFECTCNSPVPLTHAIWCPEYWKLKEFLEKGRKAGPMTAQPDLSKLHDGAPLPKTIKLELTCDEARFLRDVMCRIGGDPTTSRRKFADVIASALDGVGYKMLTVVPDIDLDQRAIYFLSQTKQTE